MYIYIYYIYIIMIMYVCVTFETLIKLLDQHVWQRPGPAYHDALRIDLPCRPKLICTGWKETRILEK